MKVIEVIKSEEWNWYKVGQMFDVKDENKYPIGIQIYNNGPDVIQHGHYKYINK